MSKAGKENELIQAIREGVEALRGGRTPRVRRVRIKAPPSYTGQQIARIRAVKLNVSQGLFAQYLGVSRSAVRSWEQRQRKPSLLACRLIQLVERTPEALKELVEV